MKDYIIEVEHLTKYYGQHRGIIDLTFQVEKGDIFGFLGPNGAGKSTFIRCLLGLIHSTSGKAKVMGKDVNKQKVDILKDIGYMPSEAMFYPDMKVKDIIALAAKIRGLDCHKEAKRLCSRLNVDVEKKIHELSLGNRKKVAIVCAMQHQPKLFIFDEPTSGLDPLMQKEFFQLVLEYHAKGTTIFLSSHTLSEVKKYCHHVAIIRDGQLVHLDTVEHITKSSGKHVHVIKDGIQKDYIYHGSIDTLLKSLKDDHIQDINITDLELEDIFMHYYQNQGEGKQ